MAINAQTIQGDWNQLRGLVKALLGSVDRRRPPDVEGISSNSSAGFSKRPEKGGMRSRDSSPT